MAIDIQIDIPRAVGGVKTIRLRREADQDVGLARPAPAAIAAFLSHGGVERRHVAARLLEPGAKPFERRLILASQLAETGQHVRYEGRAGVVGDPFD